MPNEFDPISVIGALSIFALAVLLFVAAAVRWVNNLDKIPSGGTCDECGFTYSSECRRCRGNDT